ncbi:MAG: hypothetical protein ACRD3N_13925 [Terracidiphilus sp.]
MARPVQLDFPARDREAELRARLAEAPIEHAEAIDDFLELLELLHRKNVLSMLRGVVGAGDDIICRLAKVTAQEESIRITRNLLALGKILGDIDPELIEEIGRSIPPQLKDRTARRNMHAPSFWKIARTFWSRPVRRNLLLLGVMLAGGYHFASPSSGKSR